MAPIHSRLRRWQFSFGVLAPAALLLALAGATVIVFVVWSTNGVDQRQVERERAMVMQAFERQVEAMLAIQKGIALGDGTTDDAGLGARKAWIDSQLGVRANEYFGFEATAIISEPGRLLHTPEGDGTNSPLLLGDAWPTLAPLISRMRAELAGGAMRRFLSEGASYPRVFDFVTIGNQPALATIVPIGGRGYEGGAIEGSEPLYLAIDHLDADFAGRVGREHLFEEARFTSPGAPRQEGYAGHPLLDSNGRIVAVFEWRPFRPGVEMLNQTGPVLLVAFVLAALIVTWLVNRLWTSSAALQAEKREAQHRATHDSLTGLPNRNRFDAALERELSSGRGHPAALLMIDLDRFKQVNDTLGHAAGDELIRAVARRLEQLLGPADFLARLSGDEFAVIHQCRSGERTAVHLANQIVDAIAKPFLTSAGEAFVGASVGIANWRIGESSGQELRRRADVALYEAKAKGRNGVVVYQEAMGVRLRDRHTIEARLRDALKTGERLSIALQPLFTAQGGISGAEVLVRWHDTQLGQVAPAEFVPIAESCGLIERLGDLILARALAFGARFPGRRLAINISPVQLRNPRFPERVFDLLVETAMRPSDLELEITEGILLENDGPALEAITAFRRAGIRVALDDFGTGYSSLSYLRRYPVDSIKIDRSFVAQLAPDGPSVAIVQAMVSLAHALNIEVTAEGVETDAQFAMLRQMGCNLFQGYLLGSPVSQDDMEEQLRRDADRRRNVIHLPRPGLSST